MIHQELLRRAITVRHPALRDFVETLAPTLLLRFSGVPALGGAADAEGEDDLELPSETVPLTQRDRETFSRGYDQSLAAHLFNGIFAGARVAALLPDDQALRDEEWRVWILAFVVHDYTKAHQMQIRAEHIPAIRDIIAHDGERMDFGDFFPAWRDYLDDIVFIAQNTQTVKGANLDTHLYSNLRLRPRRRERLRMLASFADVLVHIRRAADVVDRDADGRDRAGNLRKKLAWLFEMGAAPRLAYHQLTEVRGLLSNLINNALMRALEAHGYQPYLFFPDGVVYLVLDERRATLDSSTLIDALWNELGATLGGVTGDQDDPEEGDAEEGEVGMRISRTKDYMKVPPVLYELLTPQGLVVAGRTAAMRVRTALASERLGAEIADQQSIKTNTLSAKDKKALFAQLGAEYMRANSLPTDPRVDQLAEFLGFIWRRLLREWFPKADWATRLLLDELQLGDEVSVARAEAARSGTPTGWFYVAALYLKRNSLDPEALEELLGRIGTRVLQYLNEQRLAPPTKSRFEAAFRDYVASVVMVDGQSLVSADRLLDRFALELQQYTERKASNKVQCSLCSSPYEARQQDKSEVLFKPQQYSNKTRLDTSTVVRGICPICALEMMLRQVQQGMRAGSAQDEKPVTVYLYPTYFFTTETAQVIHEFISRLRDLSLPDLLFRRLGREGFTLDALMRYEEFVADDPDDTTKHTYTLNKPAFSDRDPASLFFFTLRAAMSKPTDTDSWIMPCFYALALPLLLDVKVVVSTSFVPLYGSGADFRATSMLDAPHGFTRYWLDSEHVRVNELEPSLWRLLRLYQLHIDVFSEPKDMHWGLLNTLVKDVVTDPLYVFSYYERKQRKPQAEAPKSKAKAKQGTSDTSGEGIPPFTVNRYMAIYEEMRKIRRNDPMSFIRKTVDAYAAFYRASNLKAAYAVLRPLATAIDVVVDSDPKTDDDDLLLLVAGALNDDQERVRSGQAEGFDPIATDKSLGSYPERLAISREKIATFAQIFLDEIFDGYCNSDRGILRERSNRVRSAARFFYLSRYARRDQVTEDTDDTIAELATV
jgi:CRISPR-associated protein Csc3